MPHTDKDSLFSFIVKRMTTTDSVVQINPENASNPAFGGCFMIVEEIRDWGVVGYVPALGRNRKAGKKTGRKVPYRAKWEEIDYVGEAMWVMEE